MRVGSGRPRSRTSSSSCQRAASSPPARRTIASEASTRAGTPFARSHSRAASLTGSPMTVYSKRCSSPTLPATPEPPETLPAAAVPRHRRARRDADAGDGLRQLAHQPRAQVARGGQARRLARAVLDRRAEHAQRAVALELVAPAAVAADDVDDDAEEAVEQRDDLLRRPLAGERRRADEVDEQHRDLALLAAEVQVGLVQRRAGDVLADVAAEQVLDALALAQPGGHAVEAALQQPDLARVVDTDVDVQVAVLDAGERVADRPDRLGDRLGRDDH